MERNDYLASHYSLRFKSQWYIKMDGRVPLCDDLDVLDGLTQAINMTLLEEEATIFAYDSLTLQNLVAQF